MGTMRKIYFCMILFGALSIVMGCPAKEPPKVKEIIWPLPPDPPKIKFVKIYRGEVDYEKHNPVLEGLFGKKGVRRTDINLVKPFDVVTDSAGRLYVSDTGLNAIVVFDDEKQEVRLIGIKEPARLTKPLGLAIDDQNYIYVADSKNDRVLVFNTGGELILSITREPEMQHPSGVAVDVKNKILYVSSPKEGLIHMFTLSGRYIRNFGGKGGEPGKFNRQAHMTVDKLGRLFIVDTINCRYQVFSPKAKELLYMYGTRGDAWGQFARPRGIALDTYGNIYVADAAFSNIQIFNEERQLLLFFGSKGLSEGEFQNPNGIYIDANNRIYVTDAINRRVQAFDFVGGPD